MRQFKVPGGKPPGPSTPRSPMGLGKAEKRRLLALFLGVVLVGYMMFEGMTRANRYRDTAGGDLPSEALEFQESVILPEIDGARLDALVRDADPLDRVTLESEALDVLLTDARTMTARSFEAMGTEELDAARTDALLESPRASRGRAFFARGKVDALRTRRRSPELPEEHIGRLLLDDGSTVYFLVLEIPEDPLYLRVDGLFLKNYSDEVYEQPGEWSDGPLLVGPRAIRSFESLGKVEGWEWAALYEDIQDARLNIDPPRVVRETPFAAMWHLMAFVRDLPEGEIDWASAPELTSELLTELNEDPQKWRWQPMRIPISRVQDVRIKRAGENPARIEHYTQGWIGNATWNNVIHFRSPRVNDELALGDYFVGTGFFLHNFAYDPRSASLRAAPFFVLHSVEKFEPKEDPILVQLMWGAAIGTVVLAGLFVYLLFRDRRRAKALQEEIVRRRRARRARQDGTGPPEDGPLGAPST